MPKKLFISEKPSVAQEFAKALKENFSRGDGFLESDNSIVTWCVGHLITMSYPESYDEALKKWSLETIPFLPSEYKYEVIPDVKKQFEVVKRQLNREDVSCIYVCTDSGREGEYIYRLVDAMAKVPKDKERRRVWIDSQTEEEILKGIREAKPLSAYDNLSSAAYLRAKEDYLMGINFSRVLTLKYGYQVRQFLNSDRGKAISVGRVMTCVLGMVVKREREIREFVKTPFYRVLMSASAQNNTIKSEFKAVEGSRYYMTPFMYKENGFKERKTAEELINTLSGETEAAVDSIEKKKESKKAPLLYNLAELQNECSKRFKISPDETLKVVQELYEKKLVTYPRTDARVLSTAVSKEIYKNINGLKAIPMYAPFVDEVLTAGTYKTIAKTQYCNDSQITDHYAIIPTGQGISALNSVSQICKGVYDCIVRRFLSIFYPPAEYRKVGLVLKVREERFFANFKVLAEEGYLKVAGVPGATSKNNESALSAGQEASKESSEEQENEGFGKEFMDYLGTLKAGAKLPISGFEIKEGETTPPKRYNSGSMILAMENAGQLIEDEELRAQIKGSGIGTSATRAEILNKLCKIEYLKLNKKTQILTPTLLGEMINDIVACSIRQMLDARLTASWEKGLTLVTKGEVTEKEYMDKLETFVSSLTNGVKQLNNQYYVKQYFEQAAKYYK